MSSENNKDTGAGGRNPLSRRELVSGAVAGGAAIVLGALSGPAGATTRSGARSIHLGGQVLEKAIGFSQPYTTGAIWQPLMAGAQEVAQKQGYLLLESHANSQPGLQQAEIRQWIAEGVAAIIVLPLEVNSIAPLVSRAHSNGIKVIDFSDNSLGASDGWVILNNSQGAQLLGSYAGHWVNSTLGGTAQVAVLTNTSQLTARQRTADCLAALMKLAPGARLVAQAKGVLSSQTLDPARAMLGAHPDIAVFICASDDGCLGVLEAFQATHPDAERQQQMFICGFDGSAPVIKQVLAGSSIRATAAIDAVAVGRACASAAIEAIQAKSSGRKVSFNYSLVDVHTKSLGEALLRDLQG